MKLLDIIDVNSRNALIAWCFMEAIATQEKGAIKLYLDEWNKQDSN
jgi:hypothetical protein